MRVTEGFALDLHGVLPRGWGLRGNFREANAATRIIISEDYRWRVEAGCLLTCNGIATGL